MMRTRRVFTASIRLICLVLCYMLALPFPLVSRASAMPASASQTAPAARPSMLVSAAQGTQSPYSGTPIAIPGTIQMEDFDNGGEGVAYHDSTTGNQNGSVYRTSDVDIYNDNGQKIVNYTQTGEWLEYTINVGTTSTYSLITQVWANSNGGSFHIEIDGVDVTGAMSVPNTGWGVWDTVIKTGVQLTAGQHILRFTIDAVNSNGTAGDFDSLRIVDSTVQQSPFGSGAVSVPGVVQLENFDNGGEGIAYHDRTTGNSGGSSYRNTDVDIWEDDGRKIVNYTQSGEWLEYTINVGATSTYSLVTHVWATSTGGSFHIEIDGVDVTGTLTVPNTGWGNWDTVIKTGVQLTGGQHVMRLVFEGVNTSGGAGNFDAIRIVDSTIPQTPLRDLPISAPGIIQMEDFDNGGEGTSYHDRTAGNTGGSSYRNADVDIWEDDGRKLVTGTQAGEWMEYSIRVEKTSTYSLVTSVWTYHDGGSFHIEVDGTNVTGSLSVPNMGWGVWSTVTKADVNLTAGTHLLRFVVDTQSPVGGSAGNFDAIRIVDSTVPNTPFLGEPLSLPGIIQAEDFNNGGEGIGYHDTTAGNSGGKYRNTDVDISDQEGSTMAVYPAAGEWLNYTININRTGAFTLSASVFSYYNGGTFHIEIDGVDVTGSMSVPSWQGWTLVNRTGVQIAAGQHTMRVVFDTNNTGGSGVGGFHLFKIEDEGGAGNGKILFESDRTNDYDLYLMNADGTGQTRISSNPGREGRAVWSPDGTKIAFKSGHDIYVINSDGSGQTRLTTAAEHDENPSWSPDGSKIAFHSFRTGTAQIFVMNADGSNQTRLTNNTAYEYEPTFSPSGTKIMFRSNRDGNSEIYVMNADGSSQTRLTNDAGWDSDQVWSPDGTKIAFKSNREGRDKIYVMNANGSGVTKLTEPTDFDTSPVWSPNGAKIAFLREYQTYTMNADGTSQTKVTNGTVFEFDPRWSPDGSKIAFWAYTDGSGFPTVLTVNASGTGQVDLTPNLASNFEPSWSPNGLKIAFVSNRHTQGKEIYGVNKDGSGQSNLTNNELGLDDIDPAWSPDGKQVAFSSYRDDNWDIYVMYPDGYSQTRLTNHAAADGEPSWSPDSTKILFTSDRNNDFQDEIYVMNADGSGVTLLSSSSGHESEPRWSPTGNKIAFISTRDGTDEVYVMNPDGSGQTRLTNNLDRFNYSLTWSPDGTKLAFASYIWADDHDEEDIFVVNVNGTGLTNLTNSLSALEEFPTWSPDGTKIAFEAYNANWDDLEIFVINADGSNRTQLTNNGQYVYDYDAEWSPDSTKIAFISDRDEYDAVYVMNADGSNQVRLTTNLGWLNGPKWQPLPGAAPSPTPTPTPNPTPSPTPTPTPLPTPAPDGTITVDVVALDQPFFYNRLGAVNPAGMIYALRRDVVPIDSSLGLVAGNVQLRPDKRPRPLVLRMNVGQKLQINFQNLLAPSRIDDDQPATRTASVHVIGLQLVNSITDDGSNVGVNPSSLVAPNGTATYTYYAEREGNHLFYSTAATTGGEGDGGSLAMGLFGMVNVEPQGAEWYRSQVTHAELTYATTGTTPANQPIINYDAVYPAGHPRAGLPVLKILQGSEIVHGDLNAIITGPNKGRFPEGTYRPNPAEPDRNQPFREFTLVYHDEIKAVQAFPQFFEDPVLAHTLHSVRDAFAINYGTGGIGSEILANRLGVGPMHECTECLYEEFFLSAWTVGDPAQIVDIPANAVNGFGQLLLGPKATKVFFPEDPSNVHHSYLNDHTKMRIAHAGPKEHHVHHLHAHQWLHTPDSDGGSTLDSQAFGPGWSFTTEILHGGAGNRAKTPGDSIFHCHFYPHFAMGMWGLWRVHDVFEEGTPLDGEGKPVQGTRALPDGEIARGTPIPAVVPLPTIPMAPMPQAQVSIVNGQVQVSGTGNPGFPFFVPGVAGHRPPHPPLDTVDDGGLPRHIITGGEAVHHKEHLPQFDKQKARLDFDKSLVEADAQAIPENGTPIENAAMNFHAQRLHSTFTPSGAPGFFMTNGLPPKSGAPFADPCRDDAGNPAGNPRLYKSANIQLDVKFNKAGWHFPQQRIAALWGDVADFRNGTRAPEPLFFRSNTNDCVTFQFTNLVPRVYELDDFQVRTPTDIMGQHIHLVKFDVLASDGAANGWNYEDGSFAPEEVIERITAINALGGMRTFNGASRFTLTPKPHPFFGTLGAQTTISRWFADDVLNRAGEDRTLRTAFTHDHFGPSTHQQVGLYAGLVIEPLNSTWRHSETGQIFGSRFDGGPTSWRADILTANPDDTYREFLIEFADFQHAYKAGGGIDANGHPIPDPQNAINPPGKKEVGLPFLLAPPDKCPVEEGHEGPAPDPPCPEAISADDVGTMVVNYRNEPIPHRVVNNPNASFPTQAPGLAGDLSHVFRSDIDRVFTPMNTQPNFYPPLTGGVFSRDPFTPLLRAYEDDRVQIRVLVGAHEEGHNFGVHGIKWLFEPADPNSGYRNNQMMGISEHFEFIIPTLPKSSIGSFADYLYQPGVATDDQWNGLWGIMRAYNRTQPDLQPLPNNPDGHGPIISNVGDFNGVCPKTAPVRNFEVTAVAAQDALPDGTLVYNPRTNFGGKLHDPTAILYVRSNDLDAENNLRPGVPVEPLILRASAGDCINLTLTNKLPENLLDLDGFNTLPMIVNNFNANQVKPSNHVGLHPQLVFFDVTRSDGANVGFNKLQTAAPGHRITYQWYAGDMTVRDDGLGISTPIEFGATNLQSSDPIKHSNKGAIGALIIEPPGATWIEDTNSRAQATVIYSGGSFREFVLLHQTDINLRFGERFDGQGNHKAVPNLAEAEDPEDSGQKAFNYRTEPLWKRLGFEPDTKLEITRNFIFTNSLTNTLVGGDPVTPVFTAAAGTPVRFRLLMPGGHARNSVFNLHGHVWEELPYNNNSLRLGHNPFSEWKGSQFGIGAGSHFDVLLKNGAGGRFSIHGDYLYRNQTSFMFDGGMWGLFRVSP
jgi:Tol biopolymer transport system component